MPKVLNNFTEKVRPDAVPEGAVYIGRATRSGWRKSKWANQYIINKHGSREEVIAKYESWLCDTPEGQTLLDHISDLGGKDLLCWCAPEPCHGDVLLRLANR